ncbi:group III truncated hemoglobin [Alkalilimnicola sp. S0819]|uniref:group III truncated hemoglobin n=1 Tax=Alkalilimnicola sp. S0819 TaxID=2613922 RepID=UPI00126251E1|nr:group III truncated hemoglobin [Alkalilimnicola sp. S0819]KAB7627771.1 group III truncated hemoglobin [Alkalilimnicola sp. S0819]MPQ15396.1 globin [Alkalilimnicola sp. S0819]
MSAMRERERNTHERIGHPRVAAVVDDFYSRVQVHPTLAEPFGRVDDWPEHKARLTHFWWVSLGGEAYRDDRYRVAGAHMGLGVDGALVDDWLALFEQTLHDHLEPELAEAWLQRARHMGRSIRAMLDFDPTDPSLSLGRKA